VRPLLRALTKTGSLAHYFGRDWVSVEHHPVAWVGFGHVAASRRTLFEGFIGVRTPFALTQRPSFLGKSVTTLGSLRERAPDGFEGRARAPDGFEGRARAPDGFEGRARARDVAEAIVEAYVAQSAGGDAFDLPVPAGPDPGPAPQQSDEPRADPPWSATAEEAIGTLGAGPDAHGAFRVGGDLLVSRDALAQLEARAANAAAPDLSRIVDETLAAPGVALDGVKSLASIRDVIARARSAAVQA
jgi:hypothetical protein